VPRPLQTIIALLLLAVWPVATAHCSIIAATELVSEICDVACSHDEAKSHTDACSIAESGDYTASASPLLAPAPSLTILACLVCAHAQQLAAAESLSPPVTATDNPDDWIPSWTFSFRAAPLARAPSLT
jgi:hypothetical protein